MDDSLGILIISALIIVGIILFGVMDDSPIETRIANAKESSSQATDRYLELSNDIKSDGHRWLDLDSLLMIAIPLMNGAERFEDGIRKISLNSDPLVKLCVFYIFVESLHPDASGENTGLDLLAYDLFRNNLSEEEWENHFSSEASSGDFKKPLYWAATLQTQVKKALDQFPDMFTKSNICAKFCSDISSDIDDDALKVEFSQIARKKLIEVELYTNEAEASLAALEL